MRERLLDTRDGITLHFTITSLANDGSLTETDGYLQTGTYEDGRLGEVFLRVGKPGSSSALFDQFAMLASVALQHGLDVVTVFGKHIATNFEPSGAVTGVRGFTKCTSPLDLIARFLIATFGKPADVAVIETQSAVAP